MAYAWICSMGNKQTASSNHHNAQTFSKCSILHALNFVESQGFTIFADVLRQEYFTDKLTPPKEFFVHIF